ncbi:hypothetical protein KKC97_10765 [bacterium]|nr:hypothetical protein [bacterium]
MAVGCDDDKSIVDGEAITPISPSLTLSIGTDTLWFLPGDSVATLVTIFYSDVNGNAVQGQRVEFSYSDSLLGFIEFLEPELHSTTNSQGRVDMLFTAVGIEGNEIFTASVGNITATRALAIRVIPTVIEVEIGQFPLQEEFGQDMTILFSVLYTMADGDPIAAKQLRVSANSGRVLSFSETDNAGQAFGELFVNDDFVYEIIITVTDGFAVGRDSTVISIGGD